jgi:hypothetical protein
LIAKVQPGSGKHKTAYPRDCSREWQTKHIDRIITKT